MVEEGGGWCSRLIYVRPTYSYVLWLLELSALGRVWRLVSDGLVSPQSLEGAKERQHDNVVSLLITTFPNPNPTKGTIVLWAMAVLSKNSERHQTKSFCI
ncbi:hypothetical protein L3X38_020232 [Prunus dulcis]|uniref:Uncharacterized protein n=1 Tax=Prunus dulcis TaxID=3755 RepID=A0AAD4ZDA1_PRUDU|nr:hypothetical protein L3X38_020232 [Prunus dulcis]